MLHEPALAAPVRSLYRGHSASYKPLGVINGILYILTDRDAPNRKVVAAPLDRADHANWKTVVPETKDAIEAARLVAGRIAVNRLLDVAGEVHLYNVDGSRLRAGWMAGRFAAQTFNRHFFMALDAYL